MSSPKKKRTRAVTGRQREVIEARLKRPRAKLKELGQELGISKEAVWETLNKDHVKSEMVRLMNKDEGLTASALVKKLKEGLNATETKFFQEKGRVKDKRDVIDYPTRRKYLTTALQLRGDLDKATNESDHPMRLEILVGDSATEDEKDNFARIFAAIRISRGLHPTKNQDLQDGER